MTSSTERRPVLLTWGGIECPHRNGNITHFLLNITSKNDSQSWQVKVTGDASTGSSYVVCGLQVKAVYSVSVAAVNSVNQIGVYSTYDDIYITETGNDIPIILQTHIYNTQD